MKKILLTILCALLSSALAGGSLTVYDQDGNYRYYYGDPGSHYIYDECG